jgi:hypothetical protein
MNFAERWESTDKRTLIFYFLVCLVIAMLIAVIVFTKSESYQCISSPLTYGISKYKDNTGAGFECSCNNIITDYNQKRFTFYFDEYNITEEKIPDLVPNLGIK